MGRGRQAGHAPIPQPLQVIFGVSILEYIIKLVQVDKIR
jgi:hypothetical protein